jgi:DNA-binding beta-propeller fold protein YncE
MLRRAHRGIFLLGVACACAHAPAAPSAPPPEVVWPAPPERPRVRLAAEFPDPAAPLPRRSRFRAFLDLLAGVSRADRAAAGRLARPFGVAALGDGSYLVADPDVPAVLRVDPRGTATPIACAGREWDAPMAVAAAADGAVLVADGGKGEIVRVAADGKCRAMGAGLLERPTGIAAAPDRIFVVDPPRHQLVALSYEGRELGRWGVRGDGEGQLHFPTAIARTPDGTLLVVDALNFRIARFASDGAWLGAFGAAGDAGASFARPKGIAVDPGGRVYVSDAQRDVVLVFGPDGAFECALGATGTERGHLALPAGVAVGPGRLYVADSHNHRVQVFDMMGGAP